MYNYIKVRDARASQVPADGLPERMSKVNSSHKHLLTRDCCDEVALLIPHYMFTSLLAYFLLLSLLHHEYKNRRKIMHISILILLP